MGSMETAAGVISVLRRKNSLHAALCGDIRTFTFCAVIPVYAKREKLQKKSEKDP
jgi:hypothetical protein